MGSKVLGEKNWRVPGENDYTDGDHGSLKGQFA